MVSACSLVKPTLTSGVGLFPPFSHMSVMDEKKACGGGHIINKERKNSHSLKNRTAG